MLRGIYTAASGMIAESYRNDVIANNLANVNTAGFKKDVAVSKDFASLLIERINDGENAPVIGRMGVGAMVDEVVTIQNQGAMQNTGNALDMALDGKGFFTVQTPNGLRYTRNGSFTRNSRGELVTLEGYRVMGQNGAILINSGKVTVSDDGRVLVDDIQTDRLQVVEFANEKQLAKEGDSLFVAENNNAYRQATASVRQGFTEQSTVNVVAEMVNMINGYRNYETNAKTVQSQDQLLDKAVNEVGRR